jgi:microcystin-dependent protein
MTSPFTGEIQVFGFNFAPLNWAMCNGAVMAISQNTALFSLLGTTYGGNGQTTFQLPNLQTLAACSQGTGRGLTTRSMGDQFGENAVALTSNEVPMHTHGFVVYNQTDATKRTAGPATGSGLNVVHNDTPFSAHGATANTTFSPQMLGMSGQSQPHPNIQPALAINYCIALNGVYPTFP